MTAGKYNFVIEQGADFVRELTWKERQNPDDAESALVPVDLTGMTARMKIRTRPERRLVISLTSSSGISLGGSEGTITIALSAAATAAMNFNQATYDLEMVDADGGVKRLIQGIVRLDKETTD